MAAERDASTADKRVGQKEVEAEGCSEAEMKAEDGEGAEGEAAAHSDQMLKQILQAGLGAHTHMKWHWAITHLRFVLDLLPNCYYSDCTCSA